MVGRIIGRLDDAREDLAAADAPHHRSEFLHHRVGAALPLLGAGGVLGESLAAPGAIPAQGAAQAAGELCDDLGMVGAFDQKALLGRAEVGEELGAHAVADERLRLSLDEARRGDLQHETQIVPRHLPEVSAAIVSPLIMSSVAGGRAAISRPRRSAKRAASCASPGASFPATAKGAIMAPSASSSTAMRRRAPGTR
jgi:hypothetical protein